MKSRRSQGPGASAGVLLVILAVALAGCEGGSSGFVAVPLVGAGDGPSSTPWLGLYRGNGTGSLAGDPIMPEGVTLSIRLDADSVRLEACPTCMTIRLDTLFVLENVDPVSLVSLEVTYTSDGVRRTLQLDRYSGSGGIGNVMNGRLALSGALTGSIEYVLERQ